MGTHPVIRLVGYRRLGEDAVLIHRPGLAPLRRRAALALHVIVEPGDDIATRSALEIDGLLGCNRLLYSGLRIVLSAFHWFFSAF